MYYSKGIVTRQAHVDIPEGLFEEEFARDGFFGRTSHLYRTNPPTGWTNIEGALRPEAMNVLALPGLEKEDYIEGRIPFLYNDDVVLSMKRLIEPMPYWFRNADGDECLFVHAGVGTIETDFGPLQYEKGDYLVIPRGTIYRLLPEEETTLLIVEASGEIGIPDRGMLGEHALFDPGVLNVPTPVASSNGQFKNEYHLKVKRLNQITTITYPFNPINTVGWKGDLTVWQLNIRDIRPVMSERYHLPPSAHTTFKMRNAVICTFLPRSLENGDPKALKVPFYHANIDFDEVLFYHDGDFFSRSGIDAGMITFHPQGIHHGPHPKAVEAVKGKTITEEKAVMVDTRYPLYMTKEAEATCRKDYWKSWMEEPASL
ncbi:MAG: homogentisate 1,2-dioxygenase [Ignavibacteriae bacterium]|nr:homogentisate 1,2-dioxygenase [Ignavibacteriota bacterium]MCB9217448.1 homogentisate 1,2-dioxygenase [Ignavibacteria bacterium]